MDECAIVVDANKHKPPRRNQIVVFTDGRGETLFVHEYRKMRLIEDALERPVPIGFHWFARLFEDETQRR